MAMDDEKIIGDDERDKPGEWLTLMFDGASNAMGHGIGGSDDVSQGPSLAFHYKTLL